MFCLVSWVIISSDNRLLLVEAIAPERFGNGIRHFQKLGFTHSKGTRNMASFKNACMAFVALAILAHSSASGGIVINIWQDGSNVRAHSNGGTLDYNVFPTIQGPNEYYSSLGNTSYVQANNEWIGIGYGLSLTYVNGSPITRTGNFDANTQGALLATTASGPMLMIGGPEAVGGQIQTQWTSITGKVAFYDAMDSTWAGTTMSGLGFIASPPTTTYKWGGFGANQTVTVLFSDPTPVVPEIDPAGMGSVLALVTGALGLLERRRLKTA